jgi:hypothetical protein
MKLSGSHLLPFGWLSQHCQKGIKRGLGSGEIAVSGSRFGYRKAANDPAAAEVPDPLGSEVSVLHLIPNKSLEKLNSLENDFESSKS